jgi:hypothetical protein
MHIVFVHAADYSMLTMEATGSSKTVGSIYHTMGQHILQEDNLEILIYY